MLNRKIKLFLTGLAMGVADLVPGVSGGTIAFISGVYQELLRAIKAVTGSVFSSLVARRFGEAYQAVPFGFLIPLGLGISTALFGLSGIFAWLWRDHTLFVRAFFFGLVLASTVVVLRRVTRWDWWDGAGLFLAVWVAYFLVGLIPLATPDSIWFVFLSGVLALSAMALPGVSGSFILLLLSKYQFMLEAAAARNWPILLVFALGGVVGLAVLARILLWLFRCHYDISVVILSGLMLGSVRKLWPWRVVDSFGAESLFLPVLNSALILPIALFVFGVVLVLLLDGSKPDRLVSTGVI